MAGTRGRKNAWCLLRCWSEGGTILSLCSQCGQMPSCSHTRAQSAQARTLRSTEPVTLQGSFSPHLLCACRSQQSLSPLSLAVSFPIVRVSVCLERAACMVTSAGQFPTTHAPRPSKPSCCQRCGEHSSLFALDTWYSLSPRCKELLQDVCFLPRN